MDLRNRFGLQEWSTFKLTRYSEHKCWDDFVYSPLFYIIPGYKMCLGVRVNGEGAGRGSDISLFIHLMHGNYDEHLAWPYSGKVTVSLLNQLSDRNHTSKTAKFNPANASSQRVTCDGDGVGRGFGWETFISHSKLSSLCCSYLKDDTLYFRVKGEDNTKEKCKPWLRHAHNF